MPQAAWKLTGTQAHLTCEEFSVSVNAAEPARGATDLLVAGQSIAATLFAWAPCDAAAPPLAECYVRGDDLIAEYRPYEGFPFKTHVYWRYQPALAPQESSTLQLVLSVHTHRLDTHPVYHVWSDVNNGAWQLVAADGGALGAMASGENGNYALVQSAEPGDFVSSRGPELSVADKRPRATWRLFDEFLEKGVIRRARIGVAMTPKGLSAEDAAAICRQIQRHPTPLTA